MVMLKAYQRAGSAPCPEFRGGRPVSAVLSIGLNLRERRILSCDPGGSSPEWGGNSPAQGNALGTARVVFFVSPERGETRRTCIVGARVSPLQGS